MATLVAGLARHGDEEPHRPPPASDEEAGEPGPQEPEPDRSSPVPDLPAPWQKPGSILCIAGRGLMDEAAAGMLVQILDKHGLHGRLVAYSEVSRDHTDKLDVSKTVMACISYLDITGSPAHLRYLMQRLRRRLPQGTPILVGLWPPEDSTLKDESTRKAVGADHFTSSLAATLSACQQEAHGPN